MKVSRISSLRDLFPSVVEIIKTLLPISIYVPTVGISFGTGGEETVEKSTARKPLMVLFLSFIKV